MHDRVGIVSSHVVRLCTLVDLEVVVERGSSDATVTIISLMLMVESENVHQLMHNCSASVVQKARWIEFHSGLHVSSWSSEQPTAGLTSDVGEATFELVVFVDLKVVTVGGASWTETNASDIFESIHCRQDDSSLGCSVVGGNVVWNFSVRPEMGLPLPWMNGDSSFLSHRNLHGDVVVLWWFGD